MNSIRVSAPGKLFLLGEYAVLGGAPALLTAVDQRVTVTAVHAAEWQLTTQGLGIDTLRLGPDSLIPPRLGDRVPKRLALFDKVRRQVDTHFGESGPALDVLVDSTSFQRGGHKLGLGSSAAVAVTLTAALVRARGHDLETEPDTDLVFSLADAAHRAAQGGTGSGGDIAASVRGGAILYTRNARPAAVELPTELCVFAVSTGTGSSTVELVSRVADYRSGKPNDYERDMSTLIRLAESTAETLHSASGILTLADEYFHALDTLASHSGAAIITERHRDLRKLAARFGAVFKPSGAGGGDLGLVFAKLESVDTVQSAFTKTGALVIPVPTSVDGVRIDTV